MKRQNFIQGVLLLLISFIAFSCSSEDSWCVGKWTGTTQRNEEYVVKIKKDGTADVMYHGHNVGGVYSATFSAEWEPVSGDVIRLYDSDGHPVNSKYLKFDNTWSMYLSKDGNFSGNYNRLFTNPYGQLEKK